LSRPNLILQGAAEPVGGLCIEHNLKSGKNSSARQIDRLMNVLTQLVALSAFYCLRK
jgi:hypothetical protein